MKIRFLLVAGVLFFISVFSSCHHYYHDNDVSISIKEDDEEYQLSASFDEDKTKMVQHYIDGYAGSNGIFKSGDVEVDATTTLEDNINLYIRFHPGRLKIKFNKDRNSEESYERVKDMCEGIKEILARN